MKLKDFLKDHIYVFIISIITYFLILLILLALKIKAEFIVVISIIFFVNVILIFMIDYFRKRNFYNDLLRNINALDKSYLVLETIKKPEFYEGKLTTKGMYEINKSFIEEVNDIKGQVQDFKEYIEMWIHEVKIPLSSLSLKYSHDKNIMSELKRLEDYVENVLYYVRAENAEKDYLIKETDLDKVIKNVGLKNMDDLLLNNIEFKYTKTGIKILTDAKWLEFILNQIINNSIKYKRDIKNAYILIKTIETEDKITLTIKDNGMGIKKADLKSVFDKSFTGTNGHLKAKSTGMGLYIAKNLCDKLGHKITIKSKENEYTIVSISFGKNNFYQVLN